MAMPAEVVNKGPFALLRFPDHWTEVREEAIDTATHVMRTFRPEDDSDVRVSMFTRGAPMSAQCTSQLRQLLVAGEQTLFEHADSVPAAPAQRDLIANLTEILGTAADNQVLNPSNGWQMPCFELHKLATTQLQGRQCLFLTGRYRDPDNDATTQFFCGYFFEWLPEETQSQIYELFVESGSAADFERGAKVLSTVLESAQFQ